MSFPPTSTHSQLTRTLLFLVLPLTLAACGTTTTPNPQGSNSSVTPTSSVPTGTPSRDPRVSDAKARAAKEFYAAALAEAKKKAPDVVLVRLGSQRGPDHSAHVPADGKAPHWMYSFGSASKKAEWTVSVSTLGVNVINESPVTFDPSTSLPETWMDSVEAFTAAQSAGGQSYSDAHRDEPVNFLLEMNPAAKVPSWRIAYSESDRKGTLIFFINATDGSLLKREEKPAETGSTPSA